MARDRRRRGRDHGRRRGARDAERPPALGRRDLRTRVIHRHPPAPEIGIRAALGAGTRGIVVGVLSKVVRQIVVGIVIGSAIAWQLDRAMDGGFTGGRGAYLLAVVAAMMMVTGLLAAVGPTRRALRIEPTEALKGD